MKKWLFFIMLAMGAVFCGFLQASESKKKHVPKISVKKNLIEHKHPSLKEEACNLFLSGKLSEFDPLVGENQCQIRAFMLIELYLKVQNGENLSESDCDFLEKCLILTRYKDCSTVDVYGNGSEKIDMQKAKNDGFSRRFIEEKCKLYLCKMSIQFLQKKAIESQDAALVEMLACVRSDGGGLQSVACFPGVKVIMHCLLQQAIPLAFKASVGIESESKKKVVTVLDGILPQSENMPVFVVEGFVRVPDMQSFTILCEQFSAFNRHKMIEIIELNLAAHPQYAGKKTEQTLPASSITNELCKEHKQVAQRAVKEGCAITNPIFFVANHIVCQHFKEFLEKNTDCVFLHNKTI